MKKILFALLVFASACILTAQQGSGVFDDHYVSPNASPNPNAATYTRTFTIEPAHSETIYRPNPPTPEKVDIVVVPGYNPMRAADSSTFSIVTVQKAHTSPAAANVAPQSYTQSYPAQPQQGYGYGQPQTPPSSNRFNLVPENTVPNAAPAATNSAPQSYTQSYPAQPQQGYGYEQQQTQTVSSRSNRLRIVPENTVDLKSSQNAMQGEATTVPDGDGKIKIYQVESYPVWKNPQPR
jgi:hypothetical protein